MLLTKFNPFFIQLQNPRLSSSLRLSRPIGKRSAFSGQGNRKLSVFEFNLFAVSPVKMGLAIRL